MKRFLIILAIVLVLALVLAEFIGRVVLSRVADRLIEEYTQRHPEITLEVESLSVSPIFGHMYIARLLYENEHTGLALEAKEARVSLSLPYLIQTSLRGSDALTSLDAKVDIEAQNVTYKAANESYHATANDVRVSVEAKDFRWDTSNVKQSKGALHLNFSFVDVTPAKELLDLVHKRQNILPEWESFSNLSGRITFQPTEQSFQLSNVRLRSDETDMLIRGDIHYEVDRGEWSVSKTALPLRISTPIRDGFEYQLPGNELRLRFQDIHLESELVISEGELTLPKGESYVRLGHFSMSSAHHISGNIRQYAAFFPFSLENITTETLELEAHISDEHIQIHRITMHFPAGNIILTGQLARSDYGLDREAPLQQAYLIVENPDKHITEMLKNLEMLFDIEIPREQDHYRIPLEGNLQHPAIAFRKMQRAVEP